MRFGVPPVGRHVPRCGWGLAAFPCQRPFTQVGSAGDWRWQAGAEPCSPEVIVRLLCALLALLLHVPLAEGQSAGAPVDSAHTAIAHRPWTGRAWPETVGPPLPRREERLRFDPSAPLASGGRVGAVSRDKRIIALGALAGAVVGGLVARSASRESCASRAEVESDICLIMATSGGVSVGVLGGAAAGWLVTRRKGADERSMNLSR